MTTLEDCHCVALAREWTYAAGFPLRDRYGFAASDDCVMAVLNIVRSCPDNKVAGDAIGMAQGVDIELADGYDTPIDEVYEQRIVEILRALIEQRRDAAVRSTK